MRALYSLAIIALLAGCATDNANQSASTPTTTSAAGGIQNAGLVVPAAEARSPTPAITLSYNLNGKDVVLTSNNGIVFSGEVPGKRGKGKLYKESMTGSEAARGRGVLSPDGTYRVGQEWTVDYRSGPAEITRTCKVTAVGPYSGAIDRPSAASFKCESRRGTQKLTETFVVDVGTERLLEYSGASGSYSERASITGWDES